MGDEEGVFSVSFPLVAVAVRAEVLVVVGILDDQSGIIVEMFFGSDEPPVGASVVTAHQFHPR